jgi:general secretion pathway protein A
MDYLSNFNFHTLPFTPEIGVPHLFRLEDFEATLATLVRTIEQRMPSALIGPAGSGKSAMLRALVAELPEARYRVSYIKVTGLSKRDLCRELATAIGTEPAGSFPMLVRRVQDYLLSQADGEGLRPVVLFDDAHEFRPEVLSILRILGNFEMDSRLVVSFVLAGQSPLRTLLRRDALDDVARRVASYSFLRLLSRDESKRYLEHRCTVAGADTFPFDAAATDAVYEIARGNLRATDHLARTSLLLAAEQDCSVAGSNHVIAARKQLWP